MPGGLATISCTFKKSNSLLDQQLHAGNAKIAEALKVAFYE